MTQKGLIEKIIDATNMQDAKEISTPADNKPLGKDANGAIDCYVDADFCGLWGVENPDDPIVSKSRTGFIITLAGCPTCGSPVFNLKSLSAPCMLSMWP